MNEWMGKKQQQEKNGEIGTKRIEKNKEEIDFDSFFEKHFNCYCCYSRFAYCTSKRTHTTYIVHYIRGQEQKKQMKS